MSRLSQIPIRVELQTLLPEPKTSGQTNAKSGLGGRGGGLSAILSELASLLERLARGEPSAAIDVRSLPMSQQERVDLQHVLGEGEVQATVIAEGLSSIRETRFAGVWWVEHRDQQGAVIAELIEVTRVPDILASAPDEIAAAGNALRAQIAATTLPPSRFEN